MSSNKELNSIKEELNRAKRKIVQQNDIILDLQNQIKNYNQINNKNLNMIEDLKNQITQKNNELNELKINLQNNNNINNNNNIIENDRLIKESKIICINFTSSDQKINFAIPSVSTDIFAVIEEKLYQEYPEYRETNNYFIANGNQILRFKTISDNKIVSGRPVMLLVPDQNS